MGMVAVPPLAQMVLPSVGWVHTLRVPGVRLARDEPSLARARPGRPRPQGAGAGRPARRGRARAGRGRRQLRGRRRRRGDEGGEGGGAEGGAGEGPSLTETLLAASGSGSFRLLAGGFFVCGLHVLFVPTDLPACLGRERAAKLLRNRGF